MRTMLLLAGLYLPAMASAWPGPKCLGTIPDTTILECGQWSFIVVGDTPYRLRDSLDCPAKRISHKTLEAAVTYVCPKWYMIADHLERMSEDASQ